MSVQLDEWPPRDAAEMERWLLEDMPVLRDRLEVLRERLERCEAMEHQPVTARFSQVHVARTQHSDPTYEVVRVWVAQIPRLREDMAEIERELAAYEGAKSHLPPHLRALVEARYEAHLGWSEVCEAAGISRRTYYYQRTEAMHILRRHMA